LDLILQAEARAGNDSAGARSQEVVAGWIHFGRPSVEQSVVFGVAPDPEPDEAILNLDSKGAVGRLPTRADQTCPVFLKRSDG
jgi:hypothetical protein